MSFPEVLERYREYALSSIGFFIVLIIGWFIVRKRNTTAKNAYFILFCGPVLLFQVFLLSAAHKGTLLVRLIFLTIAIFLPASLYFLFIAARRESLFNAFTTNLARLGLLRPWWTTGPSPNPTIDRRTSLTLETRTCFHGRIKSYFDRFGAVYGSLEKENVVNFVKAIEQARETRGTDSADGRQIRL